MSSPAASSQHRNSLWDAMLDAELNVCYWTWLSARYAKINKSCRAVVAVSTSGTVAAWSLWSQFPVVWKGFSAVACLVSIFYPILWPADQLKKMNNLVGSWKQIATNYEILWSRGEELRAPGAWKEFERTRAEQGKIDETDCRRRQAAAQSS